MIVVVKGISASGKTSWFQRHAEGHMMAEHGRVAGAPDRERYPREAAAFWADRNVDRWRAMEATSGLAVCDTDPLKLHYIWCLWRIGAAGREQWTLERDATRERLGAGLVGFADLYLVTEVDQTTARHRRNNDGTRRRRDFELHVRLQPALVAWYRALASVRAGTVVIGWPEHLPAKHDGGNRHDVAMFDRMMAALPA